MIMRLIRHENIVRLIDFYDEPRRYLIALELLAGGELFERIVKKTHYLEREARDVVRSLLQGIRHIHELHIVHRDLKPENLLLSSPTDDVDGVKLADFGLAAIALGNTLTQVCGTLSYAAPEVFAHAKYGKAVDMWSLGVVTYTMLGGYLPFDDIDENQLRHKIRHARYHFDPEFWAEASGEARDFISRLLVLDAGERMTVEAALQHRWMLKADDELAKTLSSGLRELRKFQARRRLKRAANTVLATQKMRLLVRSHQREHDTTAAQDATPPPSTTTTTTATTTTTTDV